MFEFTRVFMYGLQRSGINSSDVEILTLTNVTEEDAGEYICKVSNYIGEASQSGWLTVIPGNHWDLTPRALPPPLPWCGFPGSEPDLLCCGGPAGGLLVVLGFMGLFYPHVRPLCYSLGHGSTVWARGSDTQIVTARTPWKLCQAGVWCCSAVLSMLCV